MSGAKALPSRASANARPRSLHLRVAVKPRSRHRANQLLRWWTPRNASPWAARHPGASGLEELRALMRRGTISAMLAA